MSYEPNLRLIPDWPPIRQLAATRLGKTGSELQSMADGGDSLEKAELVRTVEEILDV
jgi:hypothetical protein